MVDSYNSTVAFDVFPAKEAAAQARTWAASAREKSANTRLLAAQARSFAVSAHEDLYRTIVLMRESVLADAQERQRSKRACDSQHLGLASSLAEHSQVAGAAEPDSSELTHSEALERIAQLTEALATSREIGRAQGRLMERFGIDADTAFNVLTRVSSHANRKLRDIAAELAFTGTVDGLPPTN